MQQFGIAEVADVLIEHKQAEIQRAFDRIFGIHSAME
jgi:hypothetical protein